ncbi:Sin4p ASCRUDRAFT_8237 [Ascoidea rubescens DSM 1968]|uniref:Mediator of RNA polymerase II transcription subunit 16 n=1 Tax=Ascoidea rubescens DSM 1968 TaxID=1344418 RepID=A0A1D2VGH7_9ASCO|nr:hypothetical protein ASCRUDRAFT_8237 [Ascoidea rubescens DSM 1968]ODV60603.1 hypothetical protein ASCRUDRAFT_8237 [Ascoidea rubescens DSM 1968]
MSFSPPDNPDIYSLLNQNYQNKISWSNNGVIAYSNPDSSNKYNLLLSYLRSYNGNQWELAPPKGCSIINSNLNNNSNIKNIIKNNTKNNIKTNNNNNNIIISNAIPIDTQNNSSLDQISYLLWSNNGTYLACVDSKGNMNILVSGILKDKDFIENNNSNTSNNKNKTNTPLNFAFFGSCFNSLEIIYQDTVLTQGSTPPENSYLNTSHNIYPSNTSIPTFDNYCSTYNINDSTLNIVSLKWLPIDHNFMAIKYAEKFNFSENMNANAEYDFQKFGFKYNYINSTYKNPVTHPVLKKHACIGLRKNGELILWYQGDHGLDYNKISTYLDSSSATTTNNSINNINNISNINYKSINSLNNSGHTIISHADFAFQINNSILLTVYCPLIKILKIYSIRILWEFLGNPNNQTKNQSAYQQDNNLDERFPPKLIVKKILSENISSFGFDGSSQWLSSIKSISPVYFEDNTNSNEKVDIFLTFQNSNLNEKFNTLICKYHLEKKKLGPISNVFYQISNNLKNNTNKNINDTGNNNNMNTNIKNTRNNNNTIITNSNISGYELSLKSLIKSSSPVLSIGTNKINSFLYFAYSNGNIEIRNKHSLKIIGYKTLLENPANNVNKRNVINNDILNMPSTIGNIFDVGYKLPSVGFNPLFYSFSPNVTSYVVLSSKDPNLKLFVANFDFKKELLNSPRQRLLIAVPIAISFARCTTTKINSDDLILVAQNTITNIRRMVALHYNPKTDSNICKALISIILLECYWIFNFSLTTNDNAEFIQGKSPFRKMLEIQISLGTFENWRRIKISRFAWALINLSLIPFVFQISFNAITTMLKKLHGGDEKNIKTNVELIAKLILSQVGLIRWCIDYVTFLNQQLLQFSLVFDKATALSELLIFPLLYSRIPRTFLIKILKSILQFKRFLQEHIHLNPDYFNISPGLFVELEQPINSAKSTVLRIIDNSPIDLALFEKYLEQFDEFIKKFISDRINERINASNLSNLSADKRKHIEDIEIKKIEKEFFCHGSFPQIFSKIILDLYKYGYKEVHGKMNRYKLMFYDTDWLNLSEPSNHRVEIGSFRGEKIDGLKKTLILNTLPNEEIKKCTRCGSMTVFSDKLGSHSGKAFRNPTWTTFFKQSCFCGGVWAD